MSCFGKIINDYETAKIDNYFKPESRSLDYEFRIVQPELTIHGVEVFIEETNEKGQIYKKPKRFLPENRKALSTWVENPKDVKDFIAMHIWVEEMEMCYVYQFSQAGVIKGLIDIVKQVGEENLHKVTFQLNKTGTGKDTRYALKAKQHIVKGVGASILLTELPEEAIEYAQKNPVNLQALFFNDRPWDNDSQYDMRTLDQSPKPCPPELVKVVSEPAVATSAARRKAVAHA